MGAPQDHDPARLVGKFVSNRYRVQALVGVGDRGAVYEVEDVQRGTQVAMKVVLPGSSDEVVARFAREGKAMKLLAHRNIVEIIDVGRDGEALFIVSELVRGVTVRALLADGPVAPRRALAIVRQVLEALGHAHGFGVVHRDVEPANILLVDGGDPEREADLVKIIDFGVAKLLGDTLAVVGEAALTQTGMGGLGSPLYSAPETVLGRVTDVRADLYSVGVIAFELLAGRPPFEDADPIKLLGKHARARPPTLAEAAPDRTFTPQLELLVAEALAKKPELRFRSASEMIAALDAGVISLEPIEDALPPVQRATRAPTSAVTSTILGLQVLPHMLPAPPAKLPPSTPAPSPLPLPLPLAPVAPPSPAAGAGAPVVSHAPGVAPMASRPPAPRDPVRRRQYMIGLGAFGACAAIAIIAAIATRGGGADPATTGAPSGPAAKATSAGDPGGLASADETGDPVERARGLLGKGKAAGASELLERALTGPRGSEAGVHLLLGHARFALGRRIDALSAYERAIALSSELAGDPEVRTNAVKMLDTRDTTAAILALELLAVRVAPPAREAILAQASTGRAEPVRHRARAIAERDGFADNIDRVASYTLDLKQATSCDERRTAIHKLRVEADPRAVPALVRLKGKYACIERDLADALAQLEAQR